MYHSTLGLRVIKKKKKVWGQVVGVQGPGSKGFGMTISGFGFGVMVPG